jgi:phage FluMu protein Com
MNMRIIFLCLVGIASTLCLNASQQTAGAKRTRTQADAAPHQVARVTRAAAAAAAADQHTCFSEALTPEQAAAKCPICQFEFNTDDPDTIIFKSLCCGYLMHLECAKGYLSSSSGSYVTSIKCPGCRQVDSTMLAIIRQPIALHKRARIAAPAAAPLAFEQPDKEEIAAQPVALAAAAPVMTDAAVVLGSAVEENLALPAHSSRVQAVARAESVPLVIPAEVEATVHDLIAAVIASSDTGYEADDEDGFMYRAAKPPVRAGLQSYVTAAATAIWNRLFKS